MERSVQLLLFVFLIACGCSPTDNPESVPLSTRRDTISTHPNGAPATIHRYRSDSLVERQYYRSTGTLHRLERGDSTQTYLELHEIDSAAVLRDYLQGRWRNLSADSSTTKTSAYYIFDGETLTFETPSGAPLERMNVEYQKDRTLITEEGMSVVATIIDFDTVEVTGYTLVRTKGRPE